MKYSDLESRWKEYCYYHKLPSSTTLEEAKQHYLKRNSLIDTPQIDIDPSFYKNKTLLCSLLCFYDKEYDIQNITNIIEHLYLLKNRSGLHIDVVIRNNANKIHTDLLKLEAAFHDKLKIVVETGPNIGFGDGHNHNLLNKNYDYYLIMNDDLVFNNLDWICNGIDLFASNSEIAVVGASNNPSVVDVKGFGYYAEDTSTPRDYADGSIMLLKSSAFNSVGGFDPTIEYFYFEDVDLSLRLRQRSYKIGYIDIPHRHHRSSTTNNIPHNTYRSILEHNRAKFLSRWSGYLSRKDRIITNRALISLTLDGIGDIVDCFYPAQALIGHLLRNNNQIDIYCQNSKIRFLYEFFNHSNINIIESLSTNIEYDSIYSVNKINFSYPFHTLDLLAAGLGVKHFDTNEKAIKNFILNLLPDNENIGINPTTKNIVLHIDSQRSSFEARAPKPHTFIAAIREMLVQQFTVILIGQDTESAELNKFIKSCGDRIVDGRNISIKDTVILISKADCFCGIDSGPSHVAQLLNIPSYIIYGPIHPLTKIYRHHNSGCFFHNNADTGLYHRNLQPSYYYDLSKNAACINIDPLALATSISKFLHKCDSFDWSPYYESLRSLQREIALLNIQNPIMNTYNTMIAQPVDLKTYADRFIKK